MLYNNNTVIKSYQILINSFSLCKVAQIPKPPLEAVHGPNPTLLVKYSYKSNPNQPGGFPELTVKQGQKVTFLNVHETEALWWNVQSEDKHNSGYIPGSYVMVSKSIHVTIVILAPRDGVI